MKTSALAKSIALVGALGATWASAQVKGVDWKYFGSTTTSALNEESYVLYDAGNVNRRPDGHIEVWSKGISQKAVNRIMGNIQHNSAVLNRAADSVRLSYKAPFTEIVDVTDDVAMSLIVVEAIANLNAVEASSTILWEVDCGQRMARSLSMYIDTKGGPKSTENPGQWMHVGPEGDLGVLSKMVCSKS